MAWMQANSLSVAQSGTVSAPEFRPHGGNTGVGVYAVMSRAGTGSVERKGSDGTWRRISDLVAMTADAEQPIYISGPVNTIRFKFTEGGVGSATGLVNYVEGGVRST